ncbi:MAG: hypothetical protein LBV36_08370 [Chromatiales bacterium]|jgi:hypothetical protein|nr:hypothetical protein [Chromatiales bacterium]
MEPGDSAVVYEITTLVDFPIYMTNSVMFTLLGYDSITVAGKTFDNACHWHSEGFIDSVFVGAGESWTAPGYGGVKSVLYGEDGSIQSTVDTKLRADRLMLSSVEPNVYTSPDVGLHHPHTQPRPINPSTH